MSVFAFAAELYQNVGNDRVHGNLLIQWRLPWTRRLFQDVFADAVKCFVGTGVFKEIHY